MSQDKKIPWINEGLCGFFEYDTEVYNYKLVAREKEHLQQEVSRMLACQNYDRIRTYIMQQLPILYNEYLESNQDEISNKLSYFEFTNKYLNDEKYYIEVEKILLEQGDIVPTNSSLDELGYNHHINSEEEIQELKQFITNFPSVNQEELESVWYKGNTENSSYLIFSESNRNAQKAVEDYENNLAISELLVQNYEKELAMEEQLISNSEMIVELYEAINSEVEGK